MSSNNCTLVSVLLITQWLHRETLNIDGDIPGLTVDEDGTISFDPSNNFYTLPSESNGVITGTLWSSGTGGYQITDAYLNHQDDNIPDEYLGLNVAGLTISDDGTFTFDNTTNPHGDGQIVVTYSYTNPDPSGGDLTGELVLRIDSTSQLGIDIYNSDGYMGLLNGDTYTINANYTLQ